MNKKYNIDDSFNIISKAIDKAGENKLLFLSKLALTLANQIKNNNILKNSINISLSNLN